VDIDQRLVERTLAGELTAFEELIERHGQVVFRVAARVVGRQGAEDVAQEAFPRAFHRLERLGAHGSFRAWLLQIAHNTALNELARRTPEPVGSGEETEPAAGPRAPVPEPARMLEESERRERLELKLSQLRDEHRVVLVLRDLEGLPYEQIAEITDAPTGTVKGRLHRARNELIDLMRTNTYDWELPT